MKATPPADLQPVGLPAGAVRGGLFGPPLDAFGRLPHCAPPCTALTTSAAFAGRLFASDLRWLRPSILSIEILGRPASKAARRMLRFGTLTGGARRMRRTRWSSGSTTR